MLFFFFGENYEQKNKKAKAILKAIKSKKPDANFLHFDSFDITEEKLKELLKSQGLFEEKNIVLLTNIFLNPELKKWILENIEEFKKSNSAFIFSEEHITPTEFKKIKEYAYQIENFEQKKIAKENVFKISDYIQAKKKKELWLFYHHLLENNDINDIFGIIFWSLKSLVLAEKFSEKESGLKSFPYKKAKNNLKNWKKNEANEKLFQLIKLHTTSRQGKIKLKNAIEKFLLTI